MSKNDWLEQIKDIDREMANLEDMREALYRRIDEEEANERIGCCS